MRQVNRIEHLCSLATIHSETTRKFRWRGDVYLQPLVAYLQNMIWDPNHRNDFDKSITSIGEYLAHRERHITSLPDALGENLCLYNLLAAEYDVWKQSTDFEKFPSRKLAT